jgi:hypothetical protein
VSRNLRFNPDDRLVEAAPKQLGQRIPEPLHRRLEELCDIVYDAGVPRRPTKAEIVAALVLGAPEDAARLQEMLATYGRARVQDAFVGETHGESSVIELKPRKPGPRRGGPR